MRHPWHSIAVSFALAAVAAAFSGCAHNPSGPRAELRSDEERIRERIEEYRGDVDGCYESELKVSPNVSGLDVLISLVAFTLVYGALAVVEVRLVIRAIKKGPPEVGEPHPETGRVEPATTVY